MENNDTSLAFGAPQMAHISQQHVTASESSCFPCKSLRIIKLPQKLNQKVHHFVLKKT